MYMRIQVIDRMSIGDFRERCGRRSGFSDIAIDNK